MSPGCRCRCVPGSHAGCFPFLLLLLFFSSYFFPISYRFIFFPIFPLLFSSYLFIPFPPIYLTIFSLFPKHAQLPLLSHSRRTPFPHAPPPSSLLLAQFSSLPPWCRSGCPCTDPTAAVVGGTASPCSPPSAPRCFSPLKSRNSTVVLVRCLFVVFFFPLTCESVFRNEPAEPRTGGAERSGREVRALR